MTEDGPASARTFRPPGLAGDVAVLRRAAIQDRWGLGLMAIGWVHLATFLASHALYQAGELSAPPYLVIWGVELAVVVVLIRRMVTGNGRHVAPPLVGLLVRVWITFLILGFSVASINNLTGMPPEWFKPVWGTLSTFGFAMMGWIVSLWFLVPAVQMSLTGMLMGRSTSDAYLYYAISWWLALHLIALVLERLRASAIASGEIPAPEPDRAQPATRDDAREPGLAAGSIFPDSIPAR